MFSWIKLRRCGLGSWLSPASEELALAPPPTPGTEQHGGKVGRALFVFEVGEGKQANEKFTQFLKKRKS